MRAVLLALLVLVVLMFTSVDARTKSQTKIPKSHTSSHSAPKTRKATKTSQPLASPR